MTLREDLEKARIDKDAKAKQRKAREIDENIARYQEKIRAINDNLEEILKSSVGKNIARFDAFKGIRGPLSNQYQPVRKRDMLQETVGGDTYVPSEVGISYITDPELRKLWENLEREGLKPYFEYGNFECYLPTVYISVKMP